MSDPINPTVSTDPMIHIPRTWRYGSIVAGIMVLLALLGVGLTTTNKAFAPTYWMALCPVYGLLCVWTAWIRTGHGHDANAVVRQVFHWLGVGGALFLDFAVRGSGEVSAQATGLDALLILALGCFLAGVHLEWLFSLVGVMLVATLIIVYKAEQYIWLIFAIGALAIVALIVGYRFVGRRRHGGTTGS